jgi:hypothetical protein
MESLANEKTYEVFYDSIEIGETVLEFEVVEYKEPKISINAISGSLSPKSMRLVGFIHNHRVVIQTYSDNTHNFLDPAIVRKLHLRLTTTPTLHVKVANGATIQSELRTDSILLKVQGNTIVTNFYIITLGGCDIVLGVEWLQTLGPILWDFSLMTMVYS